MDLSPNNRNGTLGQSDNIDDDPTWQSFGAPIGSCVDESCEYRSSDGDFSTFIKHTDDTYTRTLRNGTRYEYDAQGLQTAMVDRNGHRTDYHYDGQDRLKEIIDPVGKKFTLTYDANGYLDSVEDPAQRTTTFEHDTAGDLVKVTFPDQNEREFGYDSRHLMLTESNERGDLTDRSYDFSGRLVHTFLPDQAQRRSVNSQATGLIDPATYDDSTGVPFIRSQEAVSTFTDGEDLTRTVTTNGFGSATQIEDATGLIVNIERDEHNLPTRLDYAPGTNKAFSVIQTFDSDRGTRLSRRESFDIDGETETRGMEYGYHAEFNLITQITEVWGALEDEHRVAYTTTLMRDAQGNLEKIINPLDHETTLVPDGFGRMDRLTTPNGRVVDYDYYDGQDENGMLYTITETPPDGSPQRVTTITAYHADGQPQTIVSADGVEWTLDYDLRGRLERITDPLDQQVVYRYDEDGNRTGIDVYNADDPNDPEPPIYTQTQSYDALNRRIEVVLPHQNEDAVLSDHYDLSGRLIEQVDGRSQATQYRYEPELGRLETLIDAEQGRTSFEYDALNRVEAITAPNGARTAYKIDPLGRVVEEDSPDRGVQSYEYDAVDHLKTFTDARGMVSNYGYDALHRLTTMDYPGTEEDVTFIYDSDDDGCAYGLGRLCRVNDHSGQYDYDYDGYGNVKTLSYRPYDGDPMTPFVTQYTYDAGDRLDGMTLPSGRVVTHTRDTLRRLEQITTTVGGSTINVIDALKYQADGALTEQTFGNGLVLVRDYDQQGRLTNETLTASVLVASEDFEYDHNSNLKQRITPTATYKYDVSFRLASSNYLNGCVLLTLR